MRLGWAAAAGLALAAPASAMPVSTFLAKIDTLSKEGALAALTSDAALIKTELQKDAAELRAERLAAAKAGKTPAYCPAEGTQPSLEEIVAGLKSVAEAERSRTEVKDALRAYMARRFPCQR